MSTTILHQTPQTDNRIAPIPWLRGKIEYYTAEVTRLESELNHVRILLRGHQIWLAEAERRNEGEK